MPGWKQSTAGITDYEQLPDNAKAYIARVGRTGRSQGHHNIHRRRSQRNHHPGKPFLVLEVYSVSQLNREAKRLLAGHFMTVRVAGEISNLSLPSSGHIYFSLKDAQAQIRCAIKGQQQRQPFKPDNGQQVIVTAQVSLYEPRGDYQLVVEHMEEAGNSLLRASL